MPKDSYPAAARRVRLGGAARLWVSPTTGNRFKPFALPHLPISWARWLVALGSLFWSERGACLAAVLMLDRLTGTWMPVLPSQRCGTRRAGFALEDGDYVDLPTHLLIAGSFQTRRTAKLFAAANALPGWDGLHLVARPDSALGQGDAFAFLRREGEVHLADPASVLSDDLPATLRRYEGRLRIENPSH